MSDPNPGQTFEAAIGSVQKVAMKILELPRDKREGAIEIARRGYMDALVKFNIDTEHGRKIVELMVEGIRALITEIEAGGGAAGGKA